MITVSGRLAGWAAQRPNAVPVLILLVLGILTHLVGLDHPHNVVFDEFHFGKFATSYCCDHQRFFDVHPPHAKLLIAGTAGLLGYEGGLTFENIGQSYGPISAVPLRLAPALAGIALPLLFFAVLRLLGASPAGAFFGGLLLVFDNALTAHTRLIALDGIMLAAMFGALASYLAADKSRSDGRRRLLNLACGGLLGLAVGSKLIGLAMFGLIGLSLLVEMWRDRRRENVLRRLRQAGWIAAGLFPVYALGWVLHFALLTEPGPGDIWGPLTGNVVIDTFQTHYTMFESNRTLQATHPYGSPWWSWPLMLRPIFYWSGEADAKVYFLGNPVVWWGGSLLFVVVLANLALARVTRLRVDPPAGQPRPIFWLPIVGFFAAYIPLADVSRVLFMYHYLTPLLFSLLTVVLWLDYAGWTRPGGLGRQRVSYYLAIELLLLAFLLLSPLTYGLEFGASFADRVFGLFPR